MKVLCRPRPLRRELDAEGERSKVALYTFLRRAPRLELCKSGGKYGTGYVVRLSWTVPTRHAGSLFQPYRGAC